VLKVLIAEDDLMIADMIEEILVDSGYEVCGIGRTVAEAVALGLRHHPDLAVIDMRLANGERGTDVAVRLAGLDKLGIIYATANTSHVVLTAANGHACLPKPYRDVDLIRSLEIVAGLVATGIAERPFPPGFMLLNPAPIAPKHPHG
jgi:DNA-binding response OmpR family regulator